MIHRDMCPCGRTSRARQGGLTGEYSTRYICFKTREKDPLILGFVNYEETFENLYARTTTQIGTNENGIKNEVI